MPTSENNSENDPLTATLTSKLDNDLMTDLDIKMANAKTKCGQITWQEIGQPPLSENKAVSDWDVYVNAREKQCGAGKCLPI